MGTTVGMWRRVCARGGECGHVEGECGHVEGELGDVEVSVGTWR